MKVAVVVLLALGLCVLPGHMVTGAAPSAAGAVAYLDLPDGFGMGEEEEPMGEYIDFYADEYEGNAFFFVLDRSSSMRETTASGEQKFAVLKRETIRALQGLTSRSVVCLVFYDKSNDPLTFGDPPIKMEANAKANLIGRVAGVQLSEGSCMTKGAEKALGIAGKTQHEFRTMILTADGRTHCDGAELSAETVASRILAKNTKRMPINTIYTGKQTGEDWEKGKPLLERLARATGGRFKIAK